ncbi:molybdate transport system substrate-binding protein [Caulobacter sp. BE264]|uniref:molybdate ABC transporter substrate-binding protein n=1 Tax=Caulobacter sp. BE264 TaxID=2817724 RepID=UPI002860E1B8|nr:molybdate ABC transporter substrate-binding protein [Caulobacter sp. BE264]MDR7232563.1 molybdate transport system substrate-binding protein [Caulobacter sp. BE264]
MITRRPALIAVLTGLWSLAVAGAALAGETKVAVAANFTEPAMAIAARFKARTGHEAVLSFGSSGQFYTQIANGAPYEVFLSADVERPQKAEAERLAVVGSRFTYATGRLVLFSRTPGLVDGGGAVLASSRFDKLAIADPKAAPYGQAAIETLTKLKRYDAVRPRLVMGASISQAFQFVQTGAAELGFVALSQVVNDKGGSRWIVPAANHAPIEQQAVLLKTGVNNDAAKAFLAFLKSAEAKAIIRRYGYEAR